MKPYKGKSNFTNIRQPYHTEQCMPKHQFEEIVENEPFEESGKNYNLQITYHKKIKITIWSVDHQR